MRTMIVLALLSVAVLLSSCGGGGRSKKFDNAADAVGTTQGRKISEAEKEKLWDDLSEEEKDSWR